jgi:hypothetical protein
LDSFRRESGTFDAIQGGKMQLHRYLRIALWAGGVLVVVALVAGLLWLALAEAGDQAGSQGAKGVALVAAVCLLLDLITLVVLLALAEITRTPANQPTRAQPPSDKPSV